MIRENLNERCYKIGETVFAGVTYTKLGNNLNVEKTKKQNGMNYNKVVKFFWLQISGRKGNGRMIRSWKIIKNPMSLNE